MEANRQALQKGDILVYRTKGNETTHIGMAVDHEYIVHNTINSAAKFAGTVKHRASATSQDWSRIGPIHIYRLHPFDGKNQATAERACYYALEWTGPEFTIDLPGKGDFVKVVKTANDLEKEKGQTYTNAKRMSTWPQPRDGKIEHYKRFTAEMNPHLSKAKLETFTGSRSPYSSGRLELGQKTAAEAQKWDQLMAFRVIKAYVRACQRQGLSPRYGTSCDQFVMYCYQAASLRSMLGDSQLDESIIKLVAKRSKEIKLYLSASQPSSDLARELNNTQGEPFKRVLELIEQITGDRSFSGFLPQELASDAKTSSVKKLFAKIAAPESGFKLIGQLDQNGYVEDIPRQQDQPSTSGPAKEKVATLSKPENAVEKTIN